MPHRTAAHNRIRETQPTSIPASATCWALLPLPGSVMPHRQQSTPGHRVWLSLRTQSPALRSHDRPGHISVVPRLPWSTHDKGLTSSSCVGASKPGLFECFAPRTQLASTNTEEGSSPTQQLPRWWGAQRPHNSQPSTPGSIWR